MVIEALLIGVGLSTIGIGWIVKQGLAYANRIDPDKNIIDNNMRLIQSAEALEKDVDKLERKAVELQIQNCSCLAKDQLKMADEFRNRARKLRGQVR